jgi:hypothetical protein
MPVSHGLRSRPAISSFRSGTAQLMSSPDFVDALPRTALFPLLALAMFALMSTGAWIYDIHTSHQVAESEALELTGTIPTR